MTRRCRSARSELHHRQEGSILHPERESAETLERIKAEIGSLQFSAQYQQSPVPPEGNLVKREWFKYYDTAPSRGLGVKIVQSWDIATTTDERNDWSVCTTWAIKQKKFYLLDVWRARVEFPVLRRKDHRPCTFLPGADGADREGPDRGCSWSRSYGTTRHPGFQGRSVSCRKATSGCAWKRKRRASKLATSCCRMRRRGSPPSWMSCSPFHVDGTTTRSIASRSSSSGRGLTRSDRRYHFHAPEVITFEGVSSDNPYSKMAGQSPMTWTTVSRKAAPATCREGNPTSISSCPWFTVGGAIRTVSIPPFSCGGGYRFVFSECFQPFRL